MKKSLLVFALTIISSSLSANLVEIENKSDYALKGWISLVGGSCYQLNINEPIKRVQLQIEPKSVAKVPSKDCCAFAIELMEVGYKGTSKKQYSWVDIGRWGGIASPRQNTALSMTSAKAASAGAFFGAVKMAASAIKICGKSEKFKVTVQDAMPERTFWGKEKPSKNKGRIIIQNVTGK